MPSHHHVGFQQCPFQVHMMIIQGFVDSSQNLKTGGLNTDLCSNLHLKLLWKAAYSLGVWEDQTEFRAHMNFITGIAALDTDSKAHCFWDDQDIPLHICWICPCKLRYWQRGKWVCSQSIFLRLRMLILAVWVEIQKHMDSSLAFARNSLFDCEQLIFVMQIWSTFLVKTLRSVSTNCIVLATDLWRGGERQEYLTFSVTYWQRWRSWSPSGKISGSTMGTKPC